ncbi:MAG: SRPBCC family protein [Thermomicrobiales bacterium]
MTPFTPLLDATTRTVGTRTRPEGEVRVVQLSRTFPTTIDDTWDAITDPERIPRWFSPVTGDLRQGGSYQVQGNASGTIERCDAPRAFAATWEFAGQVSWIDVALEPIDAGSTRLTLTHVMQEDAHWERFGPGATGVGWDMGMLGLTLYLTSGTPMNPEESMAWMTSDDGTRFMRRSADAWAEAAIASGDDPATVRAAAARTAAFYTGAEAPAEG